MLGVLSALDLVLHNLFLFRDGSRVGSKLLDAQSPRFSFCGDPVETTLTPGHSILLFFVNKRKIAPHVVHPAEISHNYGLNQKPTNQG